MTTERRLGVLGGTFDPIHFGHLDAGDAAQRALGLDDIVLVPSHDPPHRPVDPHASAFHRFALVALALDGRAGWRTSDIEVSREGPSYTADTLRALQARGWQASQIFFILGADAFAEIATWREFPAVLDLSHFAIIARPGTTLEGAVARTPALRPRVRGGRRQPDLHEIHDTETGIFLVEAHTRDISSSDVRLRLASGRPIDDLVPAAVARHIVSHHLYLSRRSLEAKADGAVDDLHGQNERTHG